MKKFQATMILLLLLGIASLVSGAVVDQLTPAVYVMNKGSSSIGPAIRIIENNTVKSAISSISVTLAADITHMSCDQCLFQKCQDQRLSEANLLPHAIDLLALAQLVHTRKDTVGPNNCSTVIFDYNYNDPSLSSYGEIERGQLPYNFGTGEFSISVVATLTEQASIIAVPDSTNRSLPSTEVHNIFGLRIKQKNMLFFYATDTATEKIKIPASLVEEFYNPSHAVPRHYTLVITANPTKLMIYFDCEKLRTVRLKGNLIHPNLNSNIFIGRSQPHSNSADRGIEMHGLYYYPMALSESQIAQFCCCEYEGFLPPRNLPVGITAKVASSKHRIDLLAAPNFFISTTAAITLFRSINYTNQLSEVDLSERTRRLRFIITNQNGVSSRSTGKIVLVDSDNSLPIVDLNGLDKQGTNVSVINRSPVLVSPQAVVTRNIEGFPSISPTISCVLVQLTNAVDSDYEQLTVTTTSQVLSIRATNNSQTLEIVGPGLPSEFNSVLQDILYVNMKESPTTSTQRVISFLVTDTEGRKSSRHISTINLLAFDTNPPRLSLNKDDNISVGVVSFTVGSSGVYVAPKITIKHGNNFLLRAEVTLSSGPFLYLDRLSMVTVPTLALTFNQHTYIVSGVGSFSDYQTVLSTILFSSTQNPSLNLPSNSLTNVVSIYVFDGLSSNVLTIQVKFLVNHPPTLLLPDETITVQDGEDTVLIAPSADITDDNQLLQNMSIKLIGLDSNSTSTLSSGNQTGRTLVVYKGSVSEFVSILRSTAFICTDCSSETIYIQVCDMMSCVAGLIAIDVRDTKRDNFKGATIVIALPCTALIVLLLAVALLLTAILRTDRNKRKDSLPQIDKRCKDSAIDNIYDNLHPNRSHEEA